MAYKITFPSRESYVEQIKIIGQKIIDKADEILQDYHDNIKEIEIISKIRPLEISDIEINKKYSILVNEEENNNE